MAPFLHESTSFHSLPISKPFVPVFNEKTPLHDTKELSQNEEEPTHDVKQLLKYEPGRVPVQDHTHYAHEWALPSFPNIHWPALTEVPYEEQGRFGDPNFANLLSSATDIFDYTPRIGTELVGIDLANLTTAQKQDLARLVSVRGVLFFRDQKNLTIDAQRELCQFFGTLHKHATTSVPQAPGYEDVHVVYTGDNACDRRADFSPSFLWHSDVTYEVQPPSYTSLKLLSGPARGGGGDTHWSSQYAAYDALSSSMQRYIEGLSAIHSAEMQAQGSHEAGRPVRRAPVVTEHPLVRVHPVTGWKSLFFNPGFVTKIVGVPKLESDSILRYLTEVVASTQESHVRFQWREGDVAFWDNRVTNHSASYGFGPHRRHAVRVAVQAEKPYYDPKGKSQEEEYIKKYGLPEVSKDCSGKSNYND